MSLFKRTITKIPANYSTQDIVEFYKIGIITKKEAREALRIR